MNPDGLSQEPGQAGLCPDVPSYVPWPSSPKGHRLPTFSLPRLRVQCILGSPTLEAAQQLVTSVLQALGVGEWFSLRGVLGGPSSRSREYVPSTTRGGPLISLHIAVRARPFLASCLPSECPLPGTRTAQLHHDTITC